MSNKVLNYAGKRPMSLAFLVMSNLTLCLLFSGLLTPTPSKAQPVPPNPPANNENTNCPNYTTNTVKNCPEIINHGTLDHMTNCVKLGDPLPDPTYTPGTATAGSIVTVITETCANTATASTNPVSYSFKWAYYPPKPTGNLVPGTYTTKAVELCVSSDTNDCSSPGAYTMGTVTWHVINTRTTSSSATISFDPLIHGMKAVLEEIPAGWKFDNKGSVLFTKETKTTPFCCGDGSVGVESEVSGKLSGTVVGTCATPSYPLPITLGICKVQLVGAGTLGIDAQINSKSTSCPNDPPGHYCLIPNVTFTATGSINLSAFSSSLFYVTGAFSGGSAWSGTWCWYNANGVRDFDDQENYKLCYNDITLTGSYTILNGASKAISIILVKGNCPPKNKT